MTYDLINLTFDIICSRGHKLNTIWFSQTFRAPTGYPSKIPGYPARKVWFAWFRGTYRTFWPPPLHVKDPYPTGRYLDQKLWVCALSSCLIYTPPICITMRVAMLLKEHSSQGSLEHPQTRVVRFYGCKVAYVCAFKVFLADIECTRKFRWHAKGGINKVPEGLERHLDAARQKLPRDNFCRSVTLTEGSILKEEKALSCGGEAIWEAF